MKTRDFDYALPEELIAQTPLDKRDTSRLMCLDKASGAVSHHHFYELPDFLRPNDCLILNDSRVLPARLLGQRLPGGGACEVLLLIDRGNKVWECIVRPGKHLRKGAKMQFGNGELTAEVADVLPDGNRLVRFDYEGIFLEVLERLGKMPLPPYIKEELEDQERYQTVYSRVVGSAAAPTAGLHFTPELLEKIEGMGIKLGYVTLHVGLGTFRPVKENEIEQHDMHSEYCIIPPETAALINATKAAGGRVICVGTTSCRTIESWAQEDGHMEPSAGWTNIYIYPGYRFKVMDALITNFIFRNPRSSCWYPPLPGGNTFLQRMKRRCASATGSSRLGMRCLSHEEALCSRLSDMKERRAGASSGARMAGRCRLPFS